MENKVYTNKAVVTFFISVILLSGIMEYLYCTRGVAYYVAILMWMPAVSCLLANIVNCIDKKEKFSLITLLRNSGFVKTKIKYILLGVILPFIYLFIPYRIYWTMFPNNFAYTGVALKLVLQDCLPIGIIGTIVGLLTATGEEIGWRGFMVPALKERIGAKKTLIITSLFWCLWHFPLLIWGGYMDGTSLSYQLIGFVLCIFPVGVICGLLRMNSCSMWPCAFLHAAHNNYDQTIFTVITRGDNMMYYVSETGIFTIICAWVVALIMYLKFIREEN